MDNATIAAGKNQIDIEDVGPNEHVTIPLPEGGGVTVLTGRNDIGKSEALRAVEALTGQKERLSVRHEAPLGSRGKVSSAGVELTVAASTRRKGEAEFAVLTGRLSVADLVDPGIQSPEAADAKRIRALMAITRAAPDAAAFHALLGGPANYEAQVGAVATDCPDQLSLALSVKRQIEAAARRREKDAEKISAMAAGLRRQVAEVDLSVEADADKLGAEHSLAVANAAAIRERVKAANQARQAAEAAREMLESHVKDYQGPTVAEATKAVEDAHQAELTAIEAVHAARAALDAAKRQCDQASSTRATAEQACRAAREHEAAMEGWRKTIARADTPAEDEARGEERPASEQVAEADRRVTEANRAIEDGVLARAALEMKKQASDAQKASAEAESMAKRLREAAGAVDGVLTDAIAALDTDLKVRGGRLVVRSGGREKFLGELSQGVRWKAALRIAIAAVGRGGLIPIPQHAWEGLDYQNRRIVAETAREQGVNIITAEASKTPEGEAEGVTAEIYTPVTTGGGK